MRTLFKIIKAAILGTILIIVVPIGIMLLLGENNLTVAIVIIYSAILMYKVFPSEDEA